MRSSVHFVAEVHWLFQALDSGPLHQYCWLCHEERHRITMMGLQNTGRDSGICSAWGCCVILKVVSLFSSLKMLGHLFATQLYEKLKFSQNWVKCQSPTIWASCNLRLLNLFNRMLVGAKKPPQGSVHK